MAGIVSFIREGFRELGRKIGRMKLRRELAKADRERRQALTALGRKAWEERSGIAAFPEIASEIGRLAGRAGELSAAAERLGAEKAGLEARRQAEADKLDGERRAVEEEKKPVEAKLREAERRKAEVDGRLKKVESRRNEIQGELAALDRQPQADSPAAGSAKEKADRLRAEGESLAGEVPSLKTELEALGAEVGPLAQNVQRFVGEIGRIEAEKKAALSQIDAELSRVKNELRAATSESAAVGKEQTDLFEKLGLGIYDRGQVDPGLTEAAGAVASVDRARADTEERIDASLAETAAMPRMTMGKFWGLLVVIPLLIGGLVYAGSAGWSKLRERKPAPVAVAKAPAGHPLADHPAYALGDLLEKASSKEEAAKHLLEVFRKIGLGVYTGDGKKILGGAERSDKDFFLYDFHWRILARAFHHRNGLTLAAYGSAIGQGLAEMNDPARMTGILASALSRRYQEAVQKPDDPGNFIILLVDALGRKKPVPYSLSEIAGKPAERVILDPVQSFLIYLEFFMRPPHGGAAPSGLGRWLKFPRGAASMLAPSPVHAQSPCDLIKDDAQGYWGKGMDPIMELAGEFGGKIGSFLGNVTGVIGFLGDSLTLYGVDIHVQPQPYTIHLLHKGEDFVAGIQTTVTFDAEVVSDEVLKCGWMAGKKMPVKGPLKGVELHWEFYPDPSPYFNVSSQTDRSHFAGGDRTKTDEFGVSYLFLQPRICPGQQGNIKGRDLMVTVSARIVTADIPTPGFLGPGLILKLGPGTIEYLMGGRKGYARFRAEWHEGRDYTFKPRKPTRIQGDY
jgi:hypothetical protein